MDIWDEFSSSDGEILAPRRILASGGQGSELPARGSQHTSLKAKEARDVEFLFSVCVFPF